MKRLITFDDFAESYSKFKQRGVSFFLSKLHFNSIKRTKSTFNVIEKNASNFWDIPLVQKRWNKLITNDEEINYEDYLLDNYFNSSENIIKILSLGTGKCEHELYLCGQNKNIQITCIDMSEKLLNDAKEKAESLNIVNIDFLPLNINTCEFERPEFENAQYDAVLFNASLHHFKNLESLIGKKLRRILKTDGLFIINEYVGPNHLQYPKEQIIAINEALKLIPDKYRKRYRTSKIKNTVTGVGYLRMLISDPSECVESEYILPLLNKYYQQIEEKHYGNNILMLLLKDIAHNFIDNNEKKTEVLNKLFEFENNYLKSHQSDFVFGIYRNSIII